MKEILEAMDTLRAESTAAPERFGDVWPRIERWLAANAPDLRASLRPGAPAAAIDAIERDLAISLPSDVRASWLVHDGQATDAPPLYESFRLLSVAEFAASPGSGVLAIGRSPEGRSLCVDSAGRIMIVGRDARKRIPVAESLRFMLVAFGTDLDDCEIVRDERYGLVALETLATTAPAGELEADTEAGGRP